ncbi:MAG TPA: acyltransferase [Candidatus Acidoferrales bacterium]|nr:acyltransferase [Candidatus Acidoferrales bacterium]
MKLTRNALTPEVVVFLNVIRIVACEVVLISHFYTKYQPMVLDSIFFGGMLGGLGVFTFFTISGFLIAYTVFQKTENGQYGFKNYFIDRFSRIYSGLVPALIVSLIVAGGIYATNNVYFNHLITTESSLSIESFVATLTMADMVPSHLFNATASAVIGVPFSPVTISSFGFNNVLWSLVVEWWIYLFFGWLILGVLSVFGRKAATGWFKGLFFVVAVLLSVVIVALAWDYSAFILVWFLGVAALCAASNPTVRSKLSGRLIKWVFITLFFAAVIGVGYEAYIIYTLTHESFSLLFGLLIAVCIILGLFIINSKTIPSLSKLFLNKRIANGSASMAAFSYTLFLIHYPILLFLNGLNLDVNRMLLFLPIILVINEVAFLIASVTENKHKVLAVKIIKALHISPY